MHPVYTVVKIPTIPFAVAFLDTWTLPFAVLENAGRHQLAVVHIILPVMTADWCVSAEGGSIEDKKQMNNVYTQGKLLAPQDFDPVPLVPGIIPGRKLYVWIRKLLRSIL